jgi:hypothetical protein
VADRPPLRIGILTDGDAIPDWLARVIAEVRASGIGEIAMVVTRATPPGAPPRPRAPIRWWKNRNNALLTLWQWLDRRAAPRPAAAGSLRSLAPDAEWIAAVPETGRFTDRIVGADLERIRAARLDVLVRSGFRILQGGILEAAAHGVWSFHHADNRVNRGGPPAVWEVLEQSDVTGVTLQRLTAELDGGIVLARSVGATRPASFARNANGMYPRSARMMLRSLARLHAGLDPVQATGDDGSWMAYHAPLFRAPTNAQLVPRAWRLARRAVGRRLTRPFRTLTWSLAWHHAAGHTDDVPATVLYRYREVRPPQDRFWADPFVVTHQGRWWVFLEEVIFAKPVGRILVWEFGPKGPIGQPVTALERPYHLSYPFVFRHGETWYMLPETSASGRLELYRATTFPAEWTFDRALIEPFDGVDATLHQHDDGRWYLFAGLSDVGIGHSEELHLFVADSPLGPFTPHPCNPVVADVRRARMAGRLFRHGGRLYRPAQNCTPQYGSSLVIHEVTALTPGAYREVPVQEIHPDWDRRYVGIHTINAAAGLSLIDLRRSRRSAR